LPLADAVQLVQHAAGQRDPHVHELLPGVPEERDRRRAPQARRLPGRRRDADPAAPPRGLHRGVPDDARIPLLRRVEDEDRPDDLQPSRPAARARGAAHPGEGASAAPGLRPGPRAPGPARRSSVEPALRLRESDQRHMNARRPLLSLGLDLDNLWSYMKIHGDAGWDQYPSYLET